VDETTLTKSREQRAKSSEERGKRKEQGAESREEWGTRDRETSRAGIMRGEHG